MKESWEQVLSSLLQGLVGEGGRFVRSKALALAKRAIVGLRVVMLLAYSVLILCFICALSAFAALLFYSVRHKMIEIGFPAKTMFGVVWPVPLWVAAGSFAATAGLLWFSTSQFFWERALGLKSSSRHEEERPTQVNITLGNSLDEEKIAQMVDRLVEERLSSSSQSSEEKSGQPDS